jgi:DNA-binding MarR family transcriptional regulator
MSRVSNSLVKLGLIKLYENILDRRYKNFTFTNLGKRFKKEMEYH